MNYHEDLLYYNHHYLNFKNLKLLNIKKVFKLLTKSQFQPVKYFSFEKNKYLTFDCKKKAIPNKNKCIFHDNGYYKQNANEISELLLAEVDSSIFYNKELFCIGYNILKMPLIQKKILKKGVYFSYAIFFGDVDFSDGL